MRLRTVTQSSPWRNGKHRMAPTEHALTRGGKHDEDSVYKRASHKEAEPLQQKPSFRI